MKKPKVLYKIPVYLSTDSTVNHDTLLSDSEQQSQYTAHDIKHHNFLLQYALNGSNQAPSLTNQMAIKPKSNVVKLCQNLTKNNYDYEIGSQYGEAVRINDDTASASQNKIDEDEGILSGIQLYGDKLIEGNGQSGQHLIAILHKKALYLSKLQSIFQVRPDLSHIDLLNKATLKQQQMSSTDESEVEDKKEVQNKTSKIALVKKSDADHNQALQSRMDNKRAFEEEDWVVGQKCSQSPSQFIQNVFSQQQTSSKQKLSIDVDQLQVDMKENNENSQMDIDVK